MANVDVIVRNKVEGQKDVANLGKSFNDLLGTFQKNAVAAAAVGATFKKAFDLAKEGANITQLGDSFDLLNKSVLHTPDLLNQMREAVRGTVSDADLMQGVLKLTAGASDEMAQTLAGAIPQLLEIAKAANKLNPTLGDTAFLYDSISTGIKRGSPLILDNLGIVVKVGEANEEYAASLGKTVEQLTAEEKQMALLNATLESGNQLIQQAGGNVDSSADAYARLEVQVGELTTGFKQWLAEGLTPVIGGLTQTIDATENGLSSLDNFRIILGEISPVIKANSEEHIEVAKAQAEQAATTDALISESQRLIAELEAATAAAAEFKEEQIDAEAVMRLVGRQILEQGGNLQGTTRELEEMAYATGELPGHEEAMAAAIAKGNEQLREQEEAAAAAAEAAVELAQKQRELAAATGDYFATAVKSEEAIGFFNETAKEMADGFVTVGGRTAEQNEELARLGEGMEDLQGTYDKAAETIRDYELGLKGLNFTDEERNAKIAEQQQIMANAQAAMGPYTGAIDELNAITGTAVERAGQMTVNQEAVNQALFDAADAADADATQLAILGGALGLYSDEAVEAALQTALIQAKIDELAQAYVAGSIGVDEMRTGLSTFISGLNTTEEAMAGAASTADTLSGAILGIPTEHVTVFRSDLSGFVLPPTAAAEAATPTTEEGRLGGPTMASGGIIPGAYMQPRMILGHGGEEVLRPDNPRHARNAGGRGARGGGNLSITVNVTGATSDNVGNLAARGVMDAARKLGVLPI